MEDFLIIVIRNLSYICIITFLFNVIIYLFNFFIEFIMDHLEKKEK